MRLLSEAGHKSVPVPIDYTYAAALQRSLKLQEDAKVDEGTRVTNAVLLHNSGLMLNDVLFYGTPFILSPVEHQDHMVGEADNLSLTLSLFALCLNTSRSFSIRLLTDRLCVVL